AFPGPLPLRRALERQGPRWAGAPALCGAARPALRLRPEERLRGFPAPRRARILPSLEREAPEACGVHAVRLDAREPHPTALGEGGVHQYLRSTRLAPRRADHAPALPGDLGRAPDRSAAH